MILPGTGRGTAPFDAACGVAQDKLGGVEGHTCLLCNAAVQSIVRVPLHHPADGPPPRAGEDL